MRWVIAGASFFVPMLLVISIGSCFSGSEAGHGPAASMPARRMEELRLFVNANRDVLDHYAAKPGVATTSIPHLALDRFDRRGCDAPGLAWYRLADPPSPALAAGVLHRAAGDRREVDRIDGAPVSLLLPLAEEWWYWERSATPAAPRKSP